MTRETFAVALVGEEDRGWLVEAEWSGVAIDLVHTTTRARDCGRGELLVFTAQRYSGRWAGSWSSGNPACTMRVAVMPQLRRERSSNGNKS